jgi:plasmid maintenance system killer protein
MIRGFACPETEKLFNDESSRRLPTQHSIRINDQWRVCFGWQGKDAFGVEIVDYHR